MKSVVNDLDLVIHALVTKKKELLRELLRYSIESVIKEPDNASRHRSRQDIIDDLELNEKNIQIREKATGITAIDQERSQFLEIRNLLTAIRDNNDQLIIKMENDRRTLEKERVSLDKENKLSGYINQRKSTRYATGNRSLRRSSGKSSIIRGTL